MAMKISFDDFELQEDSACSYDYVEISSQDNFRFGKYCGEDSGTTIEVTGDYAVIRFHSDSNVQKRGFSLLFTSVLPSGYKKYNKYLSPPDISVPDVVRVFAGEKVTCSVTGSFPIYTTILKNSTVLVNTTSMATIQLHKDGNYTCVATSKYGTDVQMFSVILFDCGSLKNNSLQSPGYPNGYQSNLDCVWQITIPHGMAMWIHFHDFELEGDLCWYDYVEISNENNFKFGKYCGKQTGKTVEITGDYAVIKFHSDSADQERGFSLLFTAISPSPPIISMPAVERAFVSEEMTCSATGSPPIYTAILKESTVLINITTSATVRFREEGNYSCVATSKFGTDVWKVRVIIPGGSSTNNNNHSVYIDPGCGSLRNSSLQSPEYPNSYPRNMDCLYQVNIPYGMTMKIYFEDFALEEASLCRRKAVEAIGERYSKNVSLFCRDDYVEISNQNNFTFGKYCGIQTGRTVEVSGDYAVITFHSDFYGPPIIAMPALVRAFPGNEVICSVTGSPPIYTVILNDSIVLVNTTNTASVKFFKEGNYSCMATSKYGSDFTVFTVLDCGDLSSNAIKSLPDGLFAEVIGLKNLDLSSNAIKSLPDGLFAEVIGLKNLYDKMAQFSHGALIYFAFSIQLFYNKSNIIGKLIGQTRDLSLNTISFLPEGCFTKLTMLRYLYLSSNGITSLPEGLFTKMIRLNELDLSDNAITSLPEGLFATQTWLWHLFLDRNNLQRIPRRAFYAMKYISIIALSDNPIQAIESEAFNFYSSATSRLNPTESHRGVLKFTSSYFSIARLQSAMLWMGFTHTVDHFTRQNLFRPCPLGTFSAGYGKCFRCPPGGFYSDTLAYVAKGCKKCPNGSYVPFDKTPGKSILDCKACPLGTESDFFAGHRACPCLEGFYRTHRFAECRKCGNGGLLCQDDYASLKSGFWWQWRNESLKHHYQNFIQNLLSPSPRLDNSSVQYPYAIPIPYRCQEEESCKGGLDSPCGKGYEGPLCAVCSSGYHKQLRSCAKCPSKAWIAAQLSVIVVLLFLLLVFLMWKRTTKLEKDHGHHLINMFFSRLKILIGFYQVTHGLLEVFSFIDWPDSLQVVATHSGILQLNLLQIAPVHCLFSGLQVNVFGELFVLLALNLTVTIALGTSYVIYKTIVTKKHSLKDEEKSEKISQTKQLVYKNLFFFLYATYLSTVSKTASVLPLACRKLCRDGREETCKVYAKADYSIQCQGSSFNHWLILAYFSTAYIFALPVASLIVLWRQRRVISSNTDSSKDSGTEVIEGLRFLFQNYKPTSWYWELVEMSRKVVLTSALILVGEESRSYIGLAWVVAGMYGVLFSWIKPIQLASENRLMSTSLAVTVVNLGIGAVSRIPAENTSTLTEKHKDEIVMTMLVLCANTMVIAQIVVQYLMFFYEFFKRWRKNPHWSFSCCLALLIPLNDLQGEIQEMAGNNLMKTQLDTGILEKPSIADSAQDSEALTFSLCEDDVENKNKMNVKFHKGEKENIKDNHNRSHQCTQTVVSSFA
ncbi:Tolloid-like protein 2 [Stylophora pistillata]|uniref:Tolloid-like protein 2 n=1 Tax=Stylophora pistillata TaxID=50429 RepID=A0A2B4SY98_STYPI|nr:Tolloid-like protein 2 [Stylophora pistillata]